MNVIVKWIDILTEFLKRAALASIILMMLVICTAVVARTMNHPIVGDYELVELLMVATIMLGLSYVQKHDMHIKMELVVERFPLRVQAVIDCIALALTVFVCLLVAYVNFDTALSYIERGFRTDMLSIPLYPFKFLVAVGFLFWGLQALLQLVKTVITIVRGGPFKEEKAHVG